MALPTDPIMLLSVVNLKLRDYFKNLDALCEDLDADKTDLCAVQSCVPSATSTTHSATSLSDLS